MDYSNDVQSFLQQLASSSNQNFRGNASGINTLQIGATTLQTEIAALQTPASILSGNGYVTFPNGVVIQWMSGSANNPGVSNVLPLQFPSHIWAAFATASASAVALETTLTDTHHVTVTTPAAGAQNCFILAIGN